MCEEELKLNLGLFAMLCFFFFFFGQGDEKETRTDGQKARGGGETWELGINTEKSYWG